MSAVESATKAGFLVFDLLHIWEGKDKSSLRIAEWDDHPNVAGNEVIAAHLYQLIQKHDCSLGIARRDSCGQSNDAGHDYQ
jgi:hypothetical protein